MIEKDNGGGDDLPPDLSTKELRDMALILARQQSMQNYITLPHGSFLYKVETGWKSSMIEGDSTVVCVKTVRELEGAIKSLTTETIFIPLAAAITEQAIMRVCQRHAVTKTMFKEVKVAENGK